MSSQSLLFIKSPYKSSSFSEKSILGKENVIIRKKHRKIILEFEKNTFSLSLSSSFGFHFKIDITIGLNAS